MVSFSVGPYNKSDWTPFVARTWCVTSKGMSVVLLANVGLANILWPASGSITILNSAYKLCG